MLLCQLGFCNPNPSSLIKFHTNNNMSFPISVNQTYMIILCKKQVSLGIIRLHTTLAVFQYASIQLSLLYFQPSNWGITICDHLLNFSISWFVTLLKNRANAILNLLHINLHECWNNIIDSILNLKHTLSVP